MKWFNYNFAFIFILVAFQFACGQTSSKNNESNKPNEKSIIVVVNENKESNKEIETENSETNSKTIKAAFPNLMQQAETMRKAFLSEDFGEYTDFMFPYLVEVQGGKEKFVSNLNSKISNLRLNGVQFISLEIKEPIQSINAENKVFVVLPMEIKMKNPQKFTNEEGNFLAVSDDKGKSWKFIRATSKEKLRFLFPKIVDKLNFSDSKFSDSKT